LLLEPYYYKFITIKYSLIISRKLFEQNYNKYIWQKYINIHFIKGSLGQFV